MGLTSNQQSLIKAVAQNDMQLARRCALACVAEDTTQKNLWFCKNYRQILETSGANFMELPQKLQGKLYVEDASHSFRAGRYYLSEREKVVLLHIFKMKVASTRLAELGISYPNSTLLYGESGVGKTTFGRYIAYKARLPFCYLNFSHLIDSLMGNTAKNIHAVFDYVLAQPCVFMLDEIDCVSASRTDAKNSGADNEMARITISIMQELDRLHNHCIVIAATNRIDRMDEAILRRFSTKHEVKSLTKEERTAAAEQFLRDVGVNLPLDEVAEIVEKDNSTSALINDLIQLIAQEILKDFSEGAEQPKLPGEE